MNDGVVALARTLDQELVALTRGVSLACPVCSEFVMHVRGAHGLAIACPLKSTRSLRFQTTSDQKVQLTAGSTTAATAVAAANPIELQIASRHCFVTTK